MGSRCGGRWRESDFLHWSCHSSSNAKQPPKDLTSSEGAPLYDERRILSGREPRLSGLAIGVDAYSVRRNPQFAEARNEEGRDPPSSSDYCALLTLRAQAGECCVESEKLCLQTALF